MEKIQLYPENERTYNRLTEMLKQTNRVAIVQPTGTGKAMISLKYLQDHPDKKALYITSYNLNIQTVKDKVYKYGGFGKIVAMNYRNLALGVNLDNDFDIIILDEYHHCGADVTSTMLEKLLQNNPNAKVIGTTATPIRYLDNQRDMTTELFNDNIACNMSLEYAIANKLLPEFTYVTGLYDYNNTELLNEYSEYATELEGDQQQYYTNLMKKLMNSIKTASGINKIFSKHMKPNGKYVVFCDSKDQIQEIISKLKAKELDWFKDVDADPEIYSIYYGNDNVDNAENFEKFKKSQSDHIKLLFNINMASEGIHLDDIDGVIMLRKTSSMNVYIQQLGRALAVDNNSNPIIFDIVNNFTNRFIYDVIDITVNEVKRGVEEKKENLADIRKIKVFDSIKDINDILRKLNSMPINDWDRMFEKMCKMDIFPYTYNSDGTEFIDLSKISEIPNDIVQNVENSDTEEVLNWLNQQIKDYGNNRLSYPKIKKLQSVGLIEARGQFNQEDLEIYNNFCSKLPESYERIDSALFQKNFNEQLFLVKNFIDKYYFRKERQSYSLEDYIQSCIAGLIVAQKSYNPGRSYKQHVEKSMISEVAKNLPEEKTCLSLDNMYIKPFGTDEEELIEKVFTDYVIIDMLQTLSPRGMRFIELYYGLGRESESHTLKEIGKMYNISGAAVGFNIHKNLRRLRRSSSLRKEWRNH